MVTTPRFGAFPGFPTQTTPRLGSHFVCRFCHHNHSPLGRLPLSALFHRVACSLSPSGERVTRGCSRGSCVVSEEITSKSGPLIPSILPHSFVSFVNVHEDCMRET